ncbi:DUF2231 domain-containing protein [Oculatella sp. LEGE 06141]|uniref:DUF2231 domain-containing protein n=1 Tax=Oculatella sp. LEGE 06141 TaxID=1828648 RepID=UPI0018825F70|nr:DUF2231 domain-containing protein [Oculatella sp. LEGE 06141]MBE9182705.1 DUF2231 domain-containing protein [Oculatella sp. LEGE 06141]
MLNLPLNHAGLPYPDPIHPIIVHFVIAMVFFSFFCDVFGYFTHNRRLLEVSFWNLLIATISVFLAVIFGQFEAGLSQPYDAAQPTLSLHTITGWLLAVLIVVMTAWRFAMRRQNSSKLSPFYLSAVTLLSCLVFFQMMLGSQLVWVYGLHVEPVVEATRQGILK